MASVATSRKMKKMFDGTLPIVEASVITGLVRHQTETGSRLEYIFETIPVEVLTVNFNTGGMRVRYIASIYSESPEIRTVDINNTPFLEKFNNNIEGMCDVTI